MYDDLWIVLGLVACCVIATAAITYAVLDYHWRD